MCGLQVRETSEVVIHPSWSRASRTGVDLALLRLGIATTDIPIPHLTNSSLQFSDAAVFSMIGWPKGSQPRALVRGLQHGDLHLVMNAECQKLCNATILDNTVCAAGVMELCEGGHCLPAHGTG